MTDEEPRWALLPDDPEGFFGLRVGGYDRRDLKRCYTGLIKRFKPERFPDEFQRIRAAFEELDGRLRYLSRAEEPSRPAFDWGTSVPAPPEAEDVTPAPRESRPRPDVRPEATPHLEPEPPAEAPAVTLSNRLETESPADIYRDLAGRAARTPFDHYALAFLSELVVDDPLAFTGHLLEGLREFPDEPGLYAILHHSLREGPGPGVPRALLGLLARQLPSRRFFHITEPLWLELLRELPFDEFATWLRECEELCEERDPSGRLIFTVRLLQAAFFRADDAWLAEKLDEVFENYDIIEPVMAGELDLLELLQEYRAQRKGFLAHVHPLRMRIDQVIRDHCDLPEVEADRSFLECQLLIVASDNDILRAFPVDDRSYSHVLSLFYWIAEDVESRVGVERSPVEEKELSRRIREFMNRIERLTDRSRYGKLWSLFGFAYLAALVILIGAPPALTFLITDFDVLGVFFAALLVWGSLFWFLVRPRVVDPVRLKLAYGIARRSYNGLWRRELLGLMRNTHIPVDEIERQIDVLEDSAITNDDWISILMSQDYGISFYSMAQRFLH